jgi:hypothetical protein
MSAGKLIVKDGKLLVNDGKLAASTECCCSTVPACPCGDGTHPTTIPFKYRQPDSTSPTGYRGFCGTFNKTGDCVWTATVTNWCNGFYGLFAYDTMKLTIGSGGKTVTTGWPWDGSFTDFDGATGTTTSKNCNTNETITIVTTRSGRPTVTGTLELFPSSCASYRIWQDSYGCPDAFILPGTSGCVGWRTQCIGQDVVWGGSLDTWTQISDLPSGERAWQLATTSLATPNPPDIDTRCWVRRTYYWSCESLNWTLMSAEQLGFADEFSSVAIHNTAVQCTDYVVEILEYQDVVFGCDSSVPTFTPNCGDFSCGGPGPTQTYLWHQDYDCTSHTWGSVVSDGTSTAYVGLDYVWYKISQSDTSCRYRYASWGISTPPTGLDDGTVGDQVCGCTVIGGGSSSGGGGLCGLWFRDYNCTAHTWGDWYGPVAVNCSDYTNDWTYWTGGGGIATWSKKFAFGVTPDSGDVPSVDQTPYCPPPP